MQKELVKVMDPLFNSIIRANFNIGIFINEFEQKIFQDFNFVRELNNIKEVKNILIIRTDGNIAINIY